MAPDPADINQKPKIWYRRPWVVAAFVICLIIGGGFIGLVLRSFSLAMTERRAGFTANPSANNSAQSVVLATLASGDDPSVGPADAAVTVVEFLDFQCPYSRQVFPVVRQLMQQYQNRVRFIIRDYPISDVHPLASSAAEASMCAWEQGQNQFWSFHDRLFINQDSLTEASIPELAQQAGADVDALRNCLTEGRYSSEVQSDLADGLALGVRGTPTFFINGRKFEGAIPFDVFKQLIDRSL